MTQAQESPKIEERTFSEAEIKRLRVKADAANQAIADYNDWLAFLREQHEASEQERWTLGPKGFERPIAAVLNGSEEHVHQNGAVPVGEVVAPEAQG